MTSLISVFGPLAVTVLYGTFSTAWSGFIWLCAAALYLLCAPALWRLGMPA